MRKYKYALVCLVVLAVVWMGKALTHAQEPDESPQSQKMNFEGTVGGWRVLEEGQPPAMIHATVEDMKRFHEAHPEAKPGHVQGAGTANELSYHGGNVETAPKVYLVLWGSQWSNDPSGEAGILQDFLNGVGGSSWANSVTQYCQGVASGTVFCNGAGSPAGNPQGIFSAVWADNGGAAPTRPRQSQLAAEAVKAAQHFGNTS